MEIINLAWHFHTDTLSDALKELSITHHFSDVTLVTDDNKHLKAHKSIINCFIPVLRDHFNQHNLDSEVIFLNGINYEEMRSMLEFIYTGEVRILHDRMTDFMDLAKSLKMTPLNINMQLEDKGKDICSSVKDDQDQFRMEDTNPDDNVFFHRQNFFKDKDCEDSMDDHYQSQIFDTEDSQSEKNICSSKQENHDISDHQNIYEETESFEDNMDGDEDHQSQIMSDNKDNEIYPALTMEEEKTRKKGF